MQLHYLIQPLQKTGKKKKERTDEGKPIMEAAAYISYSKGSFCDLLN